MTGLLTEDVTDVDEKGKRAQESVPRQHAARQTVRILAVAREWVRLL